MCQYDSFISVALLSVLEESDAAKWVDANLRAKETVLKRRRLNTFDQRSFDDPYMSVGELLHLTKGKLLATFCCYGNLTIAGILHFDPNVYG